MTLSTNDLAKARETANAILEVMRLDAYIFEVEPHNESWQLIIECACEIDGGWKRITLQVPKELLLQSFVDDDVKKDLFNYWKQQLLDCKKINLAGDD
ncbi:MAG: hypothetical protein ACN4GM_06485 [Gammaproteobacteria bacterium]